MLLVAMPGAPSSVLAPSSDALAPPSSSLHLPKAPPPVDAEPGAIAPLEATWTWCGVTMWVDQTRWNET